MASEAADLESVKRAHELARRGEAAEAERMLRDALPRCGGTGMEAERLGTFVLARLCMRSYRETEGLVLARRAVRLADAAGALEAAAAAQNLVATAMEALEDWDALEEEIAAMEAR